MVGSTYDVVILSSSPPAISPQRNAPSRRVAVPASSPLVLSRPASPLRSTTGASTTNPRAVPIPESALRGFATVGNLVRSEHFTSRLDDDFTAIQEARLQKDAVDSIENIEKPRKRPTRKSIAATDESEKPKPKPRARKQKPKSDKEILDSDDELRRPQRPTKSPFFNDEPSESATKPPSETTDAPKLTKSGKPRKPRAKKQKAEEEEAAESVVKPKRTRVTKPKKTAVKSGNEQPDDVSVVSAHFQTGVDKDDGSRPTSVQNSVETKDSSGGHPASIWDVPDSPRPKKAASLKQRPPTSVAEPLELEQALVRRQDWTPPRDTTTTSPNADSTGKENISLVHNAEDNFTNMLSNFTYAQSPSAQTTTKTGCLTGEVMATTKRRRIELVEIPGNQTNSRESSPEKGKAPKKKPRTITDLVTEQYGQRDEESDSNNALGNFFEPRTSTTMMPSNDIATSVTNSPQKKLPRKRNSPKVPAEKGEPKTKSKSKRVSAKSAAKPKLVAEKLLSPAAAMLRLNQQDVLFGTSSQLALEESPTMIRQIQFAIKESEQDADRADNYSFVAPSAWSRLTKAKGQKALWAASTRDDDGGMLEHMQDVYIPEPDRTQDIPLLMDVTHNKPDGARNDHVGPSSFIDIDDIPHDPPPPIAISSDEQTPPPHSPKSLRLQGSRTQNYDINELDFKDIHTFESELPPSNQNAESQHTFVDIDDFDLPPSAQLQYSPATKLRPPAPTSRTGDRSPKKRGRQPKSQSTVSKASASSTPILKPSSSKRRAKPKEKTVVPSTPPSEPSRFIDIDEILDSEDDALEALSPTPPRVYKHLDAEPLPLISLSPTTSPSKATTGTGIKSKHGPLSDASLTPVHCIPTKMLEWIHIKSDIFAQITAHIRSLPPTKDPTKPTWHEKILMYDPIVLEDFTSYLNDRTSIRVFKKATQKQVKAWNQQQRVNGEPILAVEKGGEEDVLAVTKELEALMVQSWCESLSICCVWGEGRGKSGARKGLY
ncbi:hypothetical protein COCMIDRAFT_37104 [Bipolaris oryzae ATCC 44560]|uniref:Structure-specific endonuclease subunit SLX4 n=1 Tax=Bipolaris oryzae ATCC 44560 TaxID=930090 RepID=W6Z0B7_COCMI|nr:uncharacterized protein COCMIDRAFT_37104 [Bipolaris oryzae ATCC 44560]EUC45142.1 hypothetical protein COCMIDRAFT_37104 [Bipolaris oryzae ATCC 44560]